MTSKLFSTKNICFFLLLYIALLVCWGYEYGSGDHVQIIPVLLAEKNSNLFQNDLYIQNSIHDTFNERTFLLLLLKPFFDTNGWEVFILHSIFSLLLLAGLFRIAIIILQDEILSWITLLVLFFPLMYHSLGEVELYNSGLSPAEAIAAWAIVCWLERKIFPSYILIGLSTFLHPVVGLHIFLLITGVEFCLMLFNNKISLPLKKLITPVLLFLCTAGVFIFLLRNRLNDTAMPDVEFFNLFFTFRNAHHYIPHNFPIANWVILSPVYLITPIIFFKQNRYLFYFSLLTILGCLFYSIAVEQFHSVLFASTQWFKATIWLEFFSVIAVMLLVKKYFTQNIFRRSLLLVTLAACGFWVIFVFPGIPGIQNNTAYEFPFYTKTTDAIDISRQAKLKTPQDALFLQPCSFSALKFYGQRSSYVEFKALTHKKSFLTEWGERFEKVYNIKIDAGKNGFAACRAGDEYFRNLTDAEVNELQKQTDADYLLTYTSCNLHFPAVAQNDTYIIYQLKEK